MCVNIHVKLWDLNTSHGVNLASPFTPLVGGDFVNSKFATYFHHLDRLILNSKNVDKAFV